MYGHLLVAHRGSLVIDTTPLTKPGRYIPARWMLRGHDLVCQIAHAFVDTRRRAVVLAQATGFLQPF